MTLEASCERSAFIENNIGLVHSCANRFRKRGIEYEDLFQAGCVGIIKAYDAFDETRGVRFSTYAVPVILGEIKKLFRDGGTVKVSRHLKEISMRAARIMNEAAQRDDGEIAIGKLAELVGCDEQTLVEALCASRPIISLTGADDDDGHEHDIPVMCDDEAITDRLALKDAIKKLDNSERLILGERYFKNKTQSETARTMETTQVQISRRERKIIEKLRGYMTY